MISHYNWCALWLRYPFENEKSNCGRQYSKLTPKIPVSCMIPLILDGTYKDETLFS